MATLAALAAPQQQPPSESLQIAGDNSNKANGDRTEPLALQSAKAELGRLTEQYETEGGVTLHSHACQATVHVLAKLT